MNYVLDAEDTPSGTWKPTSSSEDLFRLLCHRKGWSNDYLNAINLSDHDQLKDIDAMTASLNTAHSEQKPITIAPDFDMDGIASGVLGLAGLSELGFVVNLHIPDYRRGHDLSPEDIDEIHQSFPETSILLTCDGGVNSHLGISAAQRHGWEVLVTDHHEELEPGCNADVTVNPCRMDESYRLSGICGAHVLYQVLEAYAAAYQPDKLWSIRLLRLFAGLGTVSDVMPMLYENRSIVRDSLSLARLLWVPAPREHSWADPQPELIDTESATLLQLLRHEQHHPEFVNALNGFAILLKAFAMYGKLKDIDALDEGFYGFYAAPAMNSVRRTGAPLGDCFAVFTAQDADEKLAAALRVLENNEHRKALVEHYLAELLEGDQPLAPWVYFSQAPTGMLGLLANRMMHAAKHPVVVLGHRADADQPLTGSARAPEWFEIITALDPAENLSAIGHQQACGVMAENEQTLDSLVEILESQTRLALERVDTSDQRRADLTIGSSPDCDASLDRVEPLIEMIRRVEALKPFGHGFPEPSFEVVVPARGCRVDRIGSSSQHLRLVTQTGVAALWWNAAESEFDHLAELVGTSTESLRFLGKLQLNTFMGETRLQVVISERLPELNGQQ